MYLKIICVAVYTTSCCGVVVIIILLLHVKVLSSISKGYFWLFSRLKWEYVKIMEVQEVNMEV